MAKLALRRCNWPPSRTLTGPLIEFRHPPSGRLIQFRGKKEHSCCLPISHRRKPQENRTCLAQGNILVWLRHLKSAGFVFRGRAYTETTWQLITALCLSPYLPCVVETLSWSLPVPATDFQVSCPVRTLARRLDAMSPKRSKLGFEL
jgi:hypothetical protein